MYAQLVYREEQSKALENVQLVNEAQKKYFFQHKKFAESLEELHISFKSLTQIYSYKIEPIYTFSSKHNYKPLSYNEAIKIGAYPRQRGLKEYAGGVFRVNHQEKNLTISIICGEIRHSKARFEPKYGENKVFCPKGI